jgi:hypothetical protein
LRAWASKGVLKLGPMGGERGGDLEGVASLSRAQVLTNGMEMGAASEGVA